MPSVIGREIDATGLVICSDHHPAYVHHGVWLLMLLVDRKNVWRSRRQRLHVLIEGDTVRASQISCFVNPQDYAFDEAIERAEQILR